MKQVIEWSRYFRGEDPIIPAKQPTTLSQTTYSDKIALDRVQDPPLTDEEKRLVIARLEPASVEQRILKVIESDRNQESMAKANLESTTLTAHPSESQMLAN